MRQVAINSDYSHLELWSLVLLSVNIRHRIEKTEEGWGIWVSEDDYEHSRWELASFVEENSNWPPPEPLPPTLAHGTGRPAMLAAAGLACFYAITGPWLTNNPWFQEGMVNSRAILNDGQWWRVVTGLTLHADINHLLGNIALGALVIYYLSLETGAGAALFLALTTGAFGNLINVFMHGSGHQSVGFSTAVFGMIGVLAGLRVMERGQGVKRFLAPLGAGGGLLAMLGTGGERTDLGAHLWGIAVGVLAGLLSRKLLDRSWSEAWKWRQVMLGILTIIVVLTAWYLALR